MPFAPAVTTQVVPEQGAAKWPEAPDAGAVKVTSTPGTGPFASVASAASGDEKLVLISVYCPEPAVLVIALPLPRIVQQYAVAGPALCAASVANTEKQCWPFETASYSVAAG